MLVYRISPEPYSNKLIASGAPNRWNLRGQKVIYTGSSRSLSTLELIVHRSSIKPSITYKVLVISLDIANNIQQISLNELPANWRTIRAYQDLQAIGSTWYKQKKHLVLEVPSAVIPNESNYIINTEHPDFSNKISMLKTEDYFWDSRLL